MSTLRNLSYFVLLLSPVVCSQSQSTVVRGPYLQMATSNAITVRWRTQNATDSVVRYGLSPDNLNQTKSISGARFEHEVRLSGLSANTRYYYSIGSITGSLVGADESYRFVTAPQSGQSRPTRVWVIGDSGTADTNAASVYKTYLNYPNAENTDLWLMLGNNAYSAGTDRQYQAAVFDMYSQLLRRAPMWLTRGPYDESGPFFDIFTLPKKAEAGGVPSGTEAYYSFDHGNIHFICLDSQGSDRSENGAMMTWLRQDVSKTKQKWIIAFWHHPPYSKGVYNSDTEIKLKQMRENALPILEKYGVDLVLSGHNNLYQRSYLLHGHYGLSNTFKKEHLESDKDGQMDGLGAYQKNVQTHNNENGKKKNIGTVYAVVGASGKVSDTKSNHPAMLLSVNQLGSLVLDISDNKIEASYLGDDAKVHDYFTILKGEDQTGPVLMDAQAQSSSEVSLSFNEAIDVQKAKNVSNYKISSQNGHLISVHSASVQGKVVKLKVSSIQLDEKYTVEVDSLSDKDGNEVEEKTSAEFIFRSVKTISFQNDVLPTSTYHGTVDTYVASGRRQKNFGKEHGVLADGVDGSRGQLVGLVRWDISNIPTSATILDAQIVIDIYNSSKGSYYIYSAGKSWSENAANWNNVQPNISRRTLMGQFSPGFKGTYNITFTTEGRAVIQKWLDDPASNKGIYITSAGTGDGIDMRSSEYKLVNQRPRLVVTYALNGTKSTEVQETKTPVNVLFRRGFNGYDGMEDTYVSSGRESDNYGNDPSVLADGDDGLRDELVGLLKWDVSAVPKGSVVTNVSLKLTVHNYTDNIYNFWTMLAFWNEDSATWFNTRPKINRGARVAEFSPTTKGSYTITLNKAGVSMVQGWVNGAPNNGILFDSSGTDNGVDIYSSEYKEHLSRPQLMITYY